MQMHCALSLPSGSSTKLYYLAAIDCLCVASFGGVGATISYSESLEHATDNSESQSELNEFEAGLNANVDVLITALGFTISAQIGYAGTRETSRSTTSSSSKARTRSFVLGDPDDGDYFDVQVCQR